MSDPKLSGLKTAAVHTPTHETPPPHPAPQVRAESDPIRRGPKPVEKTPDLVQRVIDRVKKM